MRKWAGIASAILVLAVTPCLAADDKLLGEVSDRALKAIEIAKPLFLKWGGHKVSYTVSVTETANALLVTFCTKKWVVTFMDGDEKIEFPRCRGFTVSLNTVTLKIIEAGGHRD